MKKHNEKSMSAEDAAEREEFEKLCGEYPLFWVHLPTLAISILSLVISLFK